MAENGYTLKCVRESEKAVVRVFSPIISEEERARRMNEIKKAAENLLRRAV